MPHPLSHKYPIPISQLCLVNTDVPAGVGAPPLDTTSDHAGTDKVCQPCQMRNPQHPSTDPPEDTRVLTTIILRRILNVNKTTSSRLDFSMCM